MADMQRQGAAGVQTLEGGSLLDEILAETKMTPGDEGYEVAKKGVQAFIAASTWVRSRNRACRAPVRS
jgi:type VI secretion system protein ImpC